MNSEEGVDVLGELEEDEKEKVVALGLEGSEILTELEKEEG